MMISCYSLLYVEAGHLLLIQAITGYTKEVTILVILVMLCHIGDIA